MTKNRPSVKNALYDWYDWLITHIPDSIKKVYKQRNRKNHMSF